MRNALLGLGRGSNYSIEAWTLFLTCFENLELDLREQDLIGMLCPRSTESKVTVRRRETKLDIGMTDFALKLERLETGI